MAFVMRRLAVLFLVLPGFALAKAPLTQQDVDSFFTVAETMAELSERYDVESTDHKPGRPKGPPMPKGAPAIPGLPEELTKLLDENGKLALGGGMLRSLAEHPEARADVQKAIKKAGFKNQAEFASVADRLFLASARSEIDASQLAQAAIFLNESGAALELLPPQARLLAKPVGELITALENVPESDIDLARKNKARFEALEKQ